jgi:hypothetical protein
MRAYTIALALFAFGFVVGGINGLALFDTNLPASQTTFGEAEIEDLTEGATAGGVTPMQGIAALLGMGAIFFEGIKTSLTILPFLMGYGIDPIIAMMIQGPIWLVYAVAVIQFFTGRSMKGLE